MKIYIPDNYDALDDYIFREERLERNRKRQELEEEIDMKDLPYYMKEGDSEE